MEENRVVAKNNECFRVSLYEKFSENAWQQAGPCPHYARITLRR
jgi:hypothetical protein